MIAQLWSRRRDNLARALAGRSHCPLIEERKGSRRSRRTNGIAIVSSWFSQSRSTNTTLLDRRKRRPLEKVIEIASGTSLAMLKAFFYIPLLSAPVVFVYSPPLRLLPTRKARGVSILLER